MSDLDEMKKILKIAKREKLFKSNYGKLNSKDLYTLLETAGVLCTGDETNKELYEDLAERAEALNMTDEVGRAKKSKFLQDINNMLCLFEYIPKSLDHKYRLAFNELLTFV